MNMKRLFHILTLAAFVMLAKPAQAQLIEGPRGYEDFKIGVAGYTYRSYDIDQTLAFLKSMEVHYMSVKDWWLPLDSTKEQMDAFKAKCREYDVEPYILGPIYMRSEAEVDRAFAYAERYGSDVFIGVPNYELTDYVIKKVKDTGIKVAIHTHGPDGAPFPNIQKVAEVYKDPSLGIGCCMDLGHSVRMGEDIVKDIKKYKAWIYDIHIKDESEASKKGQTWEMGRGVMDFRPIVKVLRQIKYKGVVSLEFEKNGKNPHPGVAESIGYLRGVCDATK
jgi:sugar phosphate isomerase/epimerase